MKRYANLASPAKSSGNLSRRRSYDDLSNGNLSYKIKHAENAIHFYLIFVCGSCCHDTFFWVSAMAKLTIEMIDSDINALILDYLTAEGYPSAAAKFSKEANLSPRQEEESVKARQQIQHSIHMGSIQDAIEALNDLEPQVSLHNSLYPESHAMIRHEFMHHSYSLRVVDEKNYQLQSSE